MRSILGEECSTDQIPDDPGEPEVDLNQFIRENSTKNENGTLCLLCNSWIKTSTSIRRHFREIHVEAGYEYFCPLCKKSYKNRSSFAYHIGLFHHEWKKLNLEVFKRQKKLKQ